MEVVTLSDLGPILAAVVGPMVAVMLAMMRYQHIDSTKTRTLIHDLIGESNRELRGLIEQNRVRIEESNRELRELIRENRELIDKNHSELTASLGEIRERLSHIEGFLRQSPPPPPESDPEPA